ncbi:MAG: gliding motility protein GldN [Bacteroidales bacterium]|nr:gliding motility protein GldN [Bacteroidales bacterium]MBS3774577.1 gliding motility protein GldN [Bacteroidales bacterium]
MKRLVLFFFLGVIIFAGNPQESQAQSIDDNVYTKENVPGKKPLNYVSLREADVMWSKKLWQMIDLRKRMNQVLYFPENEMDDRKSLIQVIMHGIDNEGLTAYRSDQFKEMYSTDEVYQEMGAGEETQQIQQPDGSTKDTVIQTGVRYDEIKKYLIKEQWVFDRKYSDLRVRVVGICPIREFIDDDTGEKRKSQAFWIYYPEARNLLANFEIFNRKNDAQRISYEDWFQQRRFNSYVVQETNVYGNRLINEYTTGKNTLLEAREIRNEIFEFEHDLWEY